MGRAQGRIETLMRDRVTAHPDEVWLKWREDTVTWRDSLAAAMRAANGLLELGVRPGDRVALMMANRPEFIWTHLGLLFIGAYSVPVNISQRGLTLEHILADSDTTTIVFQEDLRQVVLAARERVPALKHLVVADGPAGGGVDWTIERLLSAPDDVRIDLFMSAVRFLAAKGERFDARDAAQLLLTLDADKREGLHRRIAAAYFRHLTQKSKAKE